MLETLWIWRDERVAARLGWYLAVATNRMPAKYLICRRTPVDVELDAGEDELWSAHREAAKVFEETFGAVRSGELRLRELQRPAKSLMDLKVELVKRMLRHCNFCRWNCRVDRGEGAKRGTCMLDKVSRVSTYFHHLGEELPIRGLRGSGTIFFTSCNMRCGFCQNGDISKDKDNGMVVDPALLAMMMWELRVEGCHNINLVGGEPTIHLHTIVEAISLLGSVQPSRDKLVYLWMMKPDALSWRRLEPAQYLYEGELNAPILWNSNMFMSLETLEILRELVDIWLPDFKFGSNACSIKLARTPWYWETVSRNHKIIYDWGEDIVIRHLVMPNHVECCTKRVLSWISDNMPDVPVNVMDQYHPDCFADPLSPDYDPKYSEIARRPTREEILEAYRFARRLGLVFESISLEKSVFGLRP
ncbi:MAG: radical SAM protein [Nitrososphaerota archaeon]|nr:radical SAM protein [Nitrososphaerota archaeon]